MCVCVCVCASKMKILSGFVLCIYIYMHIYVDDHGRNGAFCGTTSWYGHTHSPLTRTCKIKKFFENLKFRKMADETEDVENVPPPRPSISPISLQHAQQNNVQNKFTHNDADECKAKNEPTELAFDEIRTTTYPAEDPSTTTVHVTEQSTVTTTTTTITQDDDMIFSPVTIKKQKKQVEKIRMKRKQVSQVSHTFKHTHTHTHLTQEEDQKRVVKRIRKGKKKKTGKKRSKDLEVQSSCPMYAILFVISQNIQILSYMSHTHIHIHAQMFRRVDQYGNASYCFSQVWTSVRNVMSATLS